MLFIFLFLFTNIHAIKKNISIFGGGKFNLQKNKNCISFNNETNTSTSSWFKKMENNVQNEMHSGSFLLWDDQILQEFCLILGAKASLEFDINDFIKFQISISKIQSTQEIIAISANNDSHKLKLQRKIPIAAGFSVKIQNDDDDNYFIYGILGINLSYNEIDVFNKDPNLKINEINASHRYNFDSNFGILGTFEIGFKIDDDIKIFGILGVNYAFTNKVIIKANANIAGNEENYEEGSFNIPNFIFFVAVGISIQI